MEERRKFVRVKGLQEMVYKRAQSPGPMQTVDVKNISLIGINFYALETMNKGDIIEMRFTLPGSDAPISLEGCVVWQLAGQPGKYATGTKFLALQADTEKKLAAFIQECAQRINENREFVRCVLDTELKCQQIDTGAVISGMRTVDISLGGLKVKMPSKIPNGTRVAVQFKLADDAPAIQSEAKIVWVVEKSGVGVEAGMIFTVINDTDKEKICRHIDEYCRRQQKGYTL